MALPNSNKELEVPKYDDLSSEELVEAQAHIWNHMFSFINSIALNCALQLGIPDIIHSHGKPITLSQLVSSLRINKEKSQLIYRLMRILTYSKFFVRLNISGTKSDGKEETEELYWLTPASYLLLKDGQLTLAPFVQLHHDPIMVKPFDYMREWIFTGNHVSPFEMANGKMIWELAGQDLRFNDLFNLAMSRDSGFVLHLLLKECRQVFEGIELLVDVGGGDGTTAKAIVDAFPGMKCIVQDLSHVVADLNDSENITYVGGDMFESIPSGDAILLKWILHGWNDENSIRLLKKCREAIVERGNVGGKVIIIEAVLDDLDKSGYKEETQAKLFFDIALMGYINGKERGEKEWEKLFVDAGFTRYKIYPSLGLRSLIELYP